MSLILHVDDSSFARIQIGKILKKAGHEIIHAHSGKSALELLKAATPDLIISDILMPEMDGFAFLRALKEQDNTIPVVMLTADVQKDTAKTCLELGALDLLNKPPDEDRLLSIVTKLLTKGGQ